MSVAPCILIVTTNKKEKLMSKEIRSFLAIYILPIAILCLVFVFFAPALFAQVILGMVSGVALMVMGMAFLIDYLDKK
jgi:glucan phosphoethanolaminetransferase (alkaline phosphatase superfamily)